jgi:hypothetical protein
MWTKWTDRTTARASFGGIAQTPETPINEKARRRAYHAGERLATS